MAAAGTYKTMEEAISAWNQGGGRMASQYPGEEESAQDSWESPAPASGQAGGHQGDHDEAAEAEDDDEYDEEEDEDDSSARRESEIADRLTKIEDLQQTMLKILQSNENKKKRPKRKQNKHRIYLKAKREFKPKSGTRGQKSCNSRAKSRR